MNLENDKQNGQIVDLASFRKKKDVADELARGRQPLYISHQTGKISGSDKSSAKDRPDFGDRLERIRSSLDKINRLMTELKKTSEHAEPTPSGTTKRLT